MAVSTPDTIVKGGQGDIPPSTNRRWAIGFLIAALATYVFYAMQNGVVFTSATHCLCCHVVRLQPAQSTKNGCVVALGAATSEDNFSGMAAKDIGNIVAALVEHFACIASKAVRTR